MKRRPPPGPKRKAGLLQALQQAVQLHQQGRLDQAEHHYKGILAAQPNHFDAKHLLGGSLIDRFCRKTGTGEGFAAN